MFSIALPLPLLASGRVLLHEPVEQGDLGLRRLRLHRRQRRPLPRLQVRRVRTQMWLWKNIPKGKMSRNLCIGPKPEFYVKAVSSHLGTHFTSVKCITKARR